MTALLESTSQTAPAAEAPYTLEQPPPRVLGFWDQVGFWANLGVSLLGPVGAIFVLVPQGFPRLSLVAAILAVVIGTVIGTALVALAGCRARRPAHRRWCCCADSSARGCPTS